MHKVEDTIGITGKLVKPNINISKLKFNNKFKGRKVICICPTANWTPKIWPEENFLKLIKKFSMKAFRDYIFVLIGPSSEKYKIKKLLSVKDKKIISMFGKFLWLKFFAFLKECKLFIGNDSGIMHMAALANTKTVGLFGPLVQKISSMETKTFCFWKKEPDELMGHEDFDFRKEDCS